MDELKQLRAFKAYVHQRLDAMGVPADPEPEANAKHGCRVEGRLNWLEKQEKDFLAMVDQMRTQVAELGQQLAKTLAEADTHWANFCERSGDFRKWRAAESALIAANALIERMRAALKVALDDAEPNNCTYCDEYPPDEICPGHRALALQSSDALAAHDADLKKKWDDEFRTAWDAEHAEDDDESEAEEMSARDDEVYGKAFEESRKAFDNALAAGSYVAHDAEVRAKALADAARWFDERGVYMLSRAQAAREIRALVPATQGQWAPEGGCTVKCPRCTRVGPHRLEAGEPILFCAQCSLGEGVKVRFVVVPSDGYHPLADAHESNEGPPGFQPDGALPGPVKP